MKPTTYRIGVALALFVLAGCESNPEGPRAPDFTPSKSTTNGQPTERRPITKNPHEITNPD